MLHFTPAAREKILGFLEGQENRGDLMLRVRISGQSEHGFIYEFFLDEKAQRQEDDFVLEEEGFTAAVDAGSLRNLVGATVDWKETVQGAGFDVDNPHRPTAPPPTAAPAQLDSPLARRVLEVIESRVNPGVAMHGGFVSLIDVRENTAFVRLGGGCQGCGMVDVTLKQGIEVLIKEEVPEISRVVDTTDHAGGSNPYYQPSK
jgi:Fe/S biogenesis protein NfuA